MLFVLLCNLGSGPIEKKNQFVGDRSIVWPCTNNFLRTRIRKSKGDGPDQDKPAEKVKYFFLWEC